MRSAVLRIARAPLALVALGCSALFARDAVRGVQTIDDLAFAVDDGGANAVSVHFYVVSETAVVDLLALLGGCAMALWLRFGVRAATRTITAWWVAAAVFAGADLVSLAVLDRSGLTGARGGVGIGVAGSVAGVIAALLAVAILAARTPAWERWAGAIRADPLRAAGVAALLVAAVVLARAGDDALWVREQIRQAAEFAAQETEATGGGLIVYDGLITSSSFLGAVEIAALAVLLAVAVALRGRWGLLAAGGAVATALAEVGYRLTDQPDPLLTAAALLAAAATLAALAALAGIGVILRPPR